MRRLAFAVALIACAGCSSCSSSGGGPTDAGVDAGPTDAGYDPSCSQPGTEGNSLGVGKFCEKSSQCLYVDGGPQHAGLCTLPFSPGTKQWFCTWYCTCDAECGENAICAADPTNPGGPKGCVPNVCAGSDAIPTPTCPADGGNPDAGDGG